MDQADQRHATGGRDGDYATFREVAAMVDATRERLLAEIRQLDTQVVAMFKTHEADHRQESDRRAGLIRWAVVTVITAAGVLFSIVWALTH